MIDYEGWLYMAQGDDLDPSDVVKVDGEFHRIQSEGEDEGDSVFYRTENLDGGDDDVLLDPFDFYEVYETA